MGVLEPGSCAEFFGDFTVEEIEEAHAVDVGPGGVGHSHFRGSDRSAKPGGEQHRNPYRQHRHAVDPRVMAGVCHGSHGQKFTGSQIENSPNNGVTKPLGMTLE